MRREPHGSVDPWRLGIAGLTLYASLSALGATAGGPGVAPDSVVYLEAARNVLAGRGLVVSGWDGDLVPLTRYPPLFPLVLAGLGRLGLDPLTAARALNALLFGATIALVGGAIDRFRRPSTRAAFLGAGLVATSVDVLSVHAMALSEPLFLATGLAGLSLLGGALERRGAGRLIAAAVAIALAGLDRLIGISLIATGTIALFFVPRPWPLRLRLRRAVGFLALSSLPLGLWMLWSHAVTGTVADRHVVLLGVAGWQVRSGLATISSWLLPAAGCCLGKRAIALLGGGALLVILAVLTVASRRAALGRPDRRDVTATVAGWFVVAYLAVLGLTMIVLDANQAPDDRTLTPIFVALVVIVFDRIRRLDAAPEAWGTTARRTTLAFCVALIASGAVAQLRSVAEATLVRRGFAHPAWQGSPTIARVRAVPASTSIYSNRPDAVRFLAGRPASGVPVKRDLHTRSPNPAYDAQLDVLRERLLGGRAYLVWFRMDAWADLVYPSRDELESVLGLPVVQREPDGVVYGMTRPPG